MSVPVIPKLPVAAEHRGPVQDRVGEYDIIDCRVCGFRHAVPLPTPAELDAAYREAYYSVEKPRYLERHRQDGDWWELVFDDRYDTFEEYLPPEHRRILDVGSGPGFFLLRGQQRGWHAQGIEPSRQAAEHARGLGVTVTNDFLNHETAAGLGCFDVVHMSEVLEHVPDPAGMLGLARGLLAEGGVLCVCVPNDYSPVQETLREACGFAPWWAVPPHHLNYFNRESLTDLIERAGFSVRMCEATFPIDLFPLMGDNYVGNDELGRACHAKRKTLEHNLHRAGKGAWKRKLYRALAELDLGREIIVYAVKEGGD